MLRNWALALRPSLSLDFLAGLNDSRITYSGGANGTRVNSSGNIVAATTPRFDYDPVTLAARGLLVEEARTNLLLRSGDLSNAAWTSFGAMSVTGGASDPAGGTSGVTLNDTDAANFSFRYQDVAVANDSVERVVSFFLKEGTAAQSAIQLLYFGGTPLIYNAVVTWATKTVAPGASAGANDVSITPWYDGYYRVSVKCINNSTGNTSLRAAVYPAGSASVAATGSCIAWGGQAEAGSFPTSYIPTTSASVTRTADSAVMTGTNFSDWFNAAEGTFVVASDRYAAGSAGQFILLSVDDDTANDNDEIIQIGSQFGTSLAQFLIQSGSVGQAEFLEASDISVRKYALAYKANSFAAVSTGRTLQSDSSGAVPTGLALMNIGSRPAFGGVGHLNGHIRSITFYPRRLSNEQLQALTS